MNKSESIAALATALATAQGEIENASKNAQNPHLKSRYADLAEVLNTVRPVLSRHGIAFTQMPSLSEGVVSVETMLIHKSGEWIASTISAPLNKQDSQAVGAAISYCRRYSLAAVVGIAQEDDDGESTIGKSNKQADPEVIQQLNECESLDGLTKLWGAIPAKNRTLYQKCFSNVKARLVESET